MTRTLHVFDFLETEATPSPVCVVFGDEPFLKRLALRHLRRLLFGDDDSPFATFAGDDILWRDVSDELATLTLFGGSKRLVRVEQADKFVSGHRDKLEDYVKKPTASSVLVLEVSTWANNTRLFKALNKTGLQVECRAPEALAGRRKVLDQDRLKKWLITWSAKQHDVELTPAAADLLLELIGPEFGLLDQETAKLALYAGPGGQATPQLVKDIVGGWRTKTIWELVDAAVDGDAGEALKQLDHLLHAGDHPVALFGQISWSLRRFAGATRIYEQAERRKERISLRDALVRAGIPHWNRQGLERAESQLKQLGRERAGQIYRWLLELDLALKGTHSAPQRARFVLEQLIVRMARPSKQSAHLDR